MISLYEHRLAPIGVDLGDGRLIALDADLTLPDVIPAREVFDHSSDYIGRAENIRVVNGNIIGDIHFKEGYWSLGTHSGRHSLAPDWGYADWEHFDEKCLSVMVKGELRGLTLVEPEYYPWGAW